MGKNTASAPRAHTPVRPQGQGYLPDPATPSPGRGADQNHKGRLRGWNSENLGKRCLNFFWKEVAGSKELRRSAWLVNSSATEKGLPMRRRGPREFLQGLLNFTGKACI